jgi:hypothetical protein
MAYKTKEHISTLKEILDRAAGKTVAIPIVVFSESDVNRARSVLDRLLASSLKAEVSSIRKITKQVQGI